MQSKSISYLSNLKAQQKIKDIKGFYTHCFASFLILPFLIFINLQTVPQFHWFWYAITAWCIGLVIHWVNVFAFSKMEFKEIWKEKRVSEFLAENTNEEPFQNKDFIQEQYYLKAKKQAEEIKGFYIHLIVYLFAFPLVVYVNLKFVSGFHFFWFALGGMIIALFFHWLGVFGFEFLGLGKSWEERKMKEFTNNKF